MPEFSHRPASAEAMHKAIIVLTPIFQMGDLGQLPILLYILFR